MTTKKTQRNDFSASAFSSDYFYDNSDNEGDLEEDDTVKPGLCMHSNPHRNGNEYPIPCYEVSHDQAGIEVML